MSGHNKWAQIKHKKAATDAKKSKAFGMHVRLIALESRKCGGDKNAAGLRAAIERARAINMPSDNIERAVEKGAGAGSASYEEVTYECFGPGGIAIIIEGVTDSTNRTTQEIKHLLSLDETTLGGKGSATWAFIKNADSWIAQNPMEVSDEDGEKLMKLLEAIEDHDDIKRVSTTWLEYSETPKADENSGD